MRVRVRGENAHLYMTEELIDLADGDEFDVESF